MLFGPRFSEPWVVLDIEGWTIRYRLVPDEGVPVVGELQIIPKKKNVVPSGGLSTRVLRSVAFGPVLRFGNRALAHFSREPRYPGGPLPIGAALPVFATKARGGRPRRPDLFYARIARDYVAALAAGSRKPVDRLAGAAGVPVGRMRMMVHEARERRLLAGGGHQGKAAGALTEKARALLKERGARKGGRK